MTKNYFALQWHITDKCDQRCKHCYIFAGENKSYSPEFDFETLKQIFFNYLATCEKMDKNPSIALTGGDPLLHDNVWELLHLFKEYNVPFAILGNPFSPKFKLLFIAFKQCSYKLSCSSVLKN